MSMRPITKRHVFLGADTSNRTGAVAFVGEYAALSLSIQSTATVEASRITVVGTNDDGFQSALGTPSPLIAQNGWSIVTVITGGRGLYSIDPGIRWLNVYRDGTSVLSMTTITLHGKW